jgi:hypothetical protein
MLDHNTETLSSLEPDSDARSVEVKVAGVVAILVAKAHKLRDRLAAPKESGRLSNKDAGDVLALMMTSDGTEVAKRFTELLSIPEIAEATQDGLLQLRRQFGAPRSVGVNMAVDALDGVRLEQFVRALAPSYMAQLSEV